MLLYTLIAQRRGDERGHNDILSMLMDAQSGEEPETKLTEKQIHDHILTFLAAGHETTALALTWTFYLLSEHPRVREKLLDELRAVLAGRTPTGDDLARLFYLDWVLSESMRLYPRAWMQMGEGEGGARATARVAPTIDARERGRVGPTLGRRLAKPSLWKLRPLSITGGERAGG